MGVVSYSGGAFMRHGAVVHASGKGTGSWECEGWYGEMTAVGLSKHESVEHGTPVAIMRDAHCDRDCVGLVGPRLEELKVR